MIGNLISVELSYINTNHPDFVGGGGAVFERMALAHQEQILQQQQLAQPQQFMQNNQGNSPTGNPAWDQNQQAQALQQPKPVEKKAPKKSMEGASRSSSSSSSKSSSSSAAKQEGFFGMFFGPNETAPSHPSRSTQPSLSGAPAPKPSKRRTGSSSRKMSDAPKFGMEKLPPVPATIKAINTPSEKERFEIELIQSLLVSYFNIVRKNIGDTVPKSIMHFLVNQAKDNIQNELVSQLYKEELFDELLEESPAIAQRRRACKQMLEVLRRAQIILGEVRDISLSLIHI
eukprot:TRINITY_DN3040_c0_g3_i2.p1 TRINITY_DN3040_c0_g3~~TRINITY_DN3040_c0_g3_i2.p1  ORF type:complete len:287 (-),score=100.52 TRINITY_DN3040_c0_g3_i2:2-862(-)